MIDELRRLQVGKVNIRVTIVPLDGEHLGLARWVLEPYALSLLLSLSGPLEVGVLAVRAEDDAFDSFVMWLTHELDPVLALLHFCRVHERTVANGHLHIVLQRLRTIVLLSYGLLSDRRLLLFAAVVVFNDRGVTV